MTSTYSILQGLKRDEHFRSAATWALNGNVLVANITRVSNLVFRKNHYTGYQSSAVISLLGISISFQFIALAILLVNYLWEKGGKCEKRSDKAAHALVMLSSLLNVIGNALDSVWDEPLNNVPTTISTTAGTTSVFTTSGGATDNVTTPIIT